MSIPLLWSGFVLYRIRTIAIQKFRNRTLDSYDKDIQLLVEMSNVVKTIQVVVNDKIEKRCQSADKIVCK